VFVVGCFDDGLAVRRKNAVRRTGGREEREAAPFFGACCLKCLHLGIVAIPGAGSIGIAVTDVNDQAPLSAASHGTHSHGDSFRPGTCASAPSNLARWV